MSIQLFSFSLYVQATELNLCHDENIVFGLNWPSLLANSQIFHQFWLPFLVMTKSLFTVLKPLTCPSSYIVPQSYHITFLAFYDAKKSRSLLWEPPIFMQPHLQAFLHLHVFCLLPFVSREIPAPLCR